MKDHVALIIRKRSMTLFIQRSLKKKTLPGMWAFASGTVDSNESIEETAIREAKEELAIGVKPIKVLAIHELPEMNTRLHFVICELINGQPTILASDEIEKVKWMDFQEFFNSFTDEQIGHGLIWLRTKPSLWQKEKL